MRNYVGLDEGGKLELLKALRESHPGMNNTMADMTISSMLYFSNLRGSSSADRPADKSAK